MQKNGEQRHGKIPEIQGEDTDLEDGLTHGPLEDPQTSSSN